LTGVLKKTETKRNGEPTGTQVKAEGLLAYRPFDRRGDHFDHRGYRNSELAPVEDGRERVFGSRFAPLAQHGGSGLCDKLPERRLRRFDDQLGRHYRDLRNGCGCDHDLGLLGDDIVAKSGTTAKSGYLNTYGGVTAASTLPTPSRLTPRTVVPAVSAASSPIRPA
jgi:hypothetical protein